MDIRAEALVGIIILKPIARIIIIAGILILAWSPWLFSASFNFKASEQYVIKGEDTVVFTFQYDPASGEAPEHLTIELDYDEDGTTDFTRDFESPGQAGVQPTHGVVYEKAGYFDVEARFIVTRSDEDGDPQTQVETLGPIRINVANWRIDGIGCIASTPVVSADGSMVYVGSEDGSLYAIRTENGTEKWRFGTNGQVDSSPAMDSQGYLYFGSEDGYVYCVEPEAGALEWQFPPAGQSGKGNFFSSPALDEENGHLYIGSTDNNLYALRIADGSLRWQFRTGSKIVSSPVVGHDGTVYIGSLDQFLYALNPNGTKKWRFNAAFEIRGAPALDEDGTIFVGTCGLRGEVNEKNGLHAISPAGMEHWFTGKINGFLAAPVIDRNGTIVIGSYDNRLYGVNRGSGGLSMYKTFDDDLLSSAAFASNGYLYVGGRDGTFYALNPNEGNQLKGREEFWKYELPMSVTSSSPIVKNGFVYVGACQYEEGALYSFVCENDSENSDIAPAEDAPWPQARNGLANSGKTDFTKETIAPAVAVTAPVAGTKNFDVDRKSISVTFTESMDPESIYQPPDPDRDFEGYFGFMVEPFDAPPKDFIVTSNNNNTKFTLHLPEGSSFEKGTDYTATILSRAHVEGDSNRSILYAYDWTFSQEKEKHHSNSHDSWSCFVGALFD